MKNICSSLFSGHQCLRVLFSSRNSNLAARIILVCGLCLCFTPDAAFAAEWVALKDCRLVENSSNDGDSFVVESSTPYRGKTENRYRLYFVDTAETDANSDFKRDRLKEQAKYWGSDDPDFALRMGLRAEQTVKKLLRSSFTVYTQGDYAPTMGAPRYYALVRVKDRWLDELLVEDGLVRIYGGGTSLPDGTSAENHWRRLHELERKARSEQRNGWRSASTETPEQKTESGFVAFDEKTVCDTWIYSAKDGRKVRVVPQGTTVSVISEEPNNRLRIRFKQGEKVYEGLCEQGSIQ